MENNNIQTPHTNQKIMVSDIDEKTHSTDSGCKSYLSVSAEEAPLGSIESLFRWYWGYRILLQSFPRRPKC